MNKAINKKVVITGGPGTGKTSVIEELKNRGYKCFDEGSRDIILNLSLKGKTFKSDPLTFSDYLYTVRNKHYTDSQKKEYNRKTVFFDRGVHDILAYLRYINKNNNSNLKISRTLCLQLTHMKNELDKDDFVIYDKSLFIN